MAFLIAYNDGNIDGATTFASVVTSTGAFQDRRANLGAFAAAGASTSVTFTITNGVVIDGAFMWLAVSNSGTTGTFKIDLQKGGVSQANVTVNKLDLPQYGTSTGGSNTYQPVFFKFTGTATGDGGSNWTLVVTTTGVNTVNLLYTAASDWCRAFRTTTPATAAAGDNLAICGELTGAGTHNERHVTMNLTSAVTYGSGLVNTGAAGNSGYMHISSWGFLSYASAPSTNYILRVAGEIHIGSNGTLDVASTNMVTMTIASPGVVTWTAHGFEADRKIRFRTTGALPTGISANTDYYVRNPSTNTFEVALTAGGASINTTGSQSGTHTAITGMPRNSTATFEIQPTAADGDFGFYCMDNSFVNLMGLSRTVDKNVVKCKLTTNVAAFANARAGGTVVNGSAPANTGFDPSGTSLFGGRFIDNTTNGVHGINWNGPVVTNTTQTFRIFLARGTGTNTRYIRITIGNNATLGSVTNGFYSDIDLQLGTAGTVTAVGNGTATSVAIETSGTGYLVTLIGRCSTASTTPYMHVNVGTSAGNTSYIGDTTMCYYYVDPWIITAASIPDTTFTVNADTGWLDDDVMCCSSTSRTWTDCELFQLNANAGASSLVSTMPAGFAHSGATPTQADIGLITRNVKIRSTSPTFMTYVYCSALANVNFSWTQFSYCGSNTTNKRGIEIDVGITANPKVITYCTIHDLDSGGLFQTVSGTQFKLNFSHNVMWMTSVVGTTSSITDTDHTFDNNLSMRSNAYGMQAQDIGGIFTNNIATGCAQYGFYVGEGNATFGTFSGNTTHSNAQGGMSFNNTGMKGTISNFTAWRCNNIGVGFINTSTSTGDIIFDGLTLFGNNNVGLYVESPNNVVITGTSVIASDTSFAQTHGISLQNGGVYTIDISSVDMSGTGTGLTTHTNDFNIPNAPTTLIGTANNCKFGGTNLFSSRTNLTNMSYLGIQKYGQTSGDHRTEMRYGQLKTDTTNYASASPSMRMTPNSASFKLESAPKGKGLQVAVNSGGAVVASVSIRKDSAYNGAQPRLILRANAAIGILTNTVLATYASANGSWNTIFNTTPGATDDGVMEFIVDCDGTAGYINVDDWIFTEGIAAQTLTAGLVTDTDVFSVPVVTQGAGFTTWASSTATNVTLSSGDLVATSTATSNSDQGVRTTSGKAAGKFYFETTFTTVTGTNIGCGICLSTVEYLWWNNAGRAGVVCFPNGGAIMVNESYGGVSLGGSATSGTLFCVAVDFDNLKIWFRRGASGNWNANASYDPATNTGGVSFASGTYFPINGFGSSPSGAVTTTNFGSSAFAGTVPSGFTAGWT